MTAADRDTVDWQDRARARRPRTPRGPRTVKLYTLTESTPDQRVLATRALLASAENDALLCAADAQAALDQRDYSRAATACHRAHQHTRVADALREVLR